MPAASLAIRLLLALCVRKGELLDRWADANRIVVLHPQVAESLVFLFNPRGCRDWRGYTGGDYTTRNGAPLATVRRMLVAVEAR